MRAIRERDAERPLFLYVAFNAPHGPLQAPPEAVAAYESIQDSRRRTYAAMVSEMDRAVGRILDALRESGMLAQTLVIWCSDNGGALRLGADNSPLRGGKGGAFEGGIRVPAALWMPGVVEGGGTLRQVMTVTDWLPTLAAAAKVSGISPSSIDGVDMWPAITRGDIAIRPEPYVVGVFGNIAVIDGDWKYVQARQRGRRGMQGFLFDLAEDPTESSDISAMHPERTAALAAVLEHFPRAPTVAPDVLPPGRGGGGGPARRAGQGPPQQPGRGGGAIEGWKEITKPAWVNAAARN